MRKVILGLWFSLTFAAYGQLVFFDFNTTPATPPVTEDLVNDTPTVLLTGVDVISGGAPGVAYVDASGTPHTDGLAGAFGNGVIGGNNQIVFTVNTTGLFDLSLSYDYRSDPTGPSGAQLFAFDGIQFHPIDSESYTRDGQFHRTTRDLSAQSVVENAGEISFVWFSFGGGSGTGTFRMDNLELTSVPEPLESALVAGLALFAFVLCRRAFSPSHRAIRSA